MSIRIRQKQIPIESSCLAAVVWDGTAVRLNLRAQLASRRRKA
ncbi:hypothetical protein NB311A_09261 [Nitrobacter sp. Nb-311A]|nr:hypothetical protein NB311A_09261 [Nitrobacter sp. Nb-311A]